MNTTTRAQRINARQDQIWENYKRQQNSFDQSPIGETLAQRKRDCDLIAASAKAKNWKETLEGIDYQIGAWKSLKDDIQAAIR